MAALRAWGSHIDNMIFHRIIDLGERPTQAQETDLELWSNELHDPTIWNMVLKKSVAQWNAILAWWTPSPMGRDGLTGAI